MIQTSHNWPALMGGAWCEMGGLVFGLKSWSWAVISWGVDDGPCEGLQVHLHLFFQVSLAATMN